MLGRLGITEGEPLPSLNEIELSFWLRDNFIPPGQRVRVFDIDGLAVADSLPGLALRPVADSYVVTEAIPGEPLPPARPAGTAQPDLTRTKARDARNLARANAELAAEVTRALDGGAQTGLRWAEDGHRVISVSIPVRHVRQVLGVLTLEAGDVDQILAAQRRALWP